MNEIEDKLADPLNPDDLNELVLEAASSKATPGNASIIWGDTDESGSHRLKVEPAESPESIAEQLVEAGNNEADLEQRIATVINTRAKE